jgi:hypothetical protein
MKANKLQLGRIRGKKLSLKRDSVFQDCLRIEQWYSYLRQDERDYLNKTLSQVFKST